MRRVTAKTVLPRVGMIFLAIVIGIYIVPSKTGSSLLLAKPKLSNVGITLKVEDQWKPPVEDTANLPLCPENPPNLRSNVQPKERKKALKDGPSILQHVQLGGTYQPRACRAREHVAIVVPYRNREKHLRRFVAHMHHFLQKQQLQYTIFVTEMFGNKTFNIGMMQNIGFVTADRTDNFTCFIIHDVDLLPTNENNLYRCDNKTALHFATNNSKFNYSLPYKSYVGGVIAFTRAQFYRVNGYSNLYFGWGGQDDDIGRRLKHCGVGYRHVPEHTGAYTAMAHERDPGNPVNTEREKFSREARAVARMDQEGLNSLEYRVVEHSLKDLYTWILVEIDQEKIMKGWNYTEYD